MNGNSNRILGALCAVAVAQIVATAPIAAQQTSSAPGQVAQSSVGQAGQRQTAEGVDARYRPKRRIPTRIQNRIQSRIATRIDRFHDTQSDAVSSFEAAEDQIRRPR